MKQISSAIQNSFCQKLRHKFFFLFIGLISATTRAEDKITISGISSGGFMASQMATIYSSHISGVGTIAGGFFYCAQNHLQEKIEEGNNNPFLGTRNLFLFEASPKLQSDLITGQAFFSLQGDSQWIIPSVGNPIYQAVGICMQNPIVSTLPNLKEFAEKNLIDSTENLKSQQIYIYQGDSDTVVNPDMAQRLVAFYSENQVDKKQIKIKTLPGGHNFPTDKSGLNACKTQSMPYISSCKFNLAEDMLEHLLQKKLTHAKSNIENLYLVDQNLEPINNNLEEKQWKSPASSLAAYGYFYASPACLSNPGSCQLHVALHGCEMSDSFDLELDQSYQKQIRQSQILSLAESKKDFTFWSAANRPTNEQRKLSYGTLKFAVLSGYIELAEKNNLMFLFPQTWVSSQNYPYNPKGCWDWFGANGADYATNKGVETSWLIQYIEKIQHDPRPYILSTKPNLEKVKEKN